MHGSGKFRCTLHICDAQGKQITRTTTVDAGHKGEAQTLAVRQICLHEGLNWRKCTLLPSRIEYI
jgi:hypothetical protein